MKRIPLQVYFFANSLRPMAHFLLKSEDLGFLVPIRAIVDTGSPITLIGTSDLRRMRLSSIRLKKLVGKHNEVNIGGGKVITRILEKANVRFGSELNIEMPVQFPIKGEDSQPSLLGVDFLLKTKSKLVFDPHKKEAYLEMEESP